MKGSWAFLLFYVRQINDRWRCDNTRVVTVTREKSPQLKIRNVRSRQRRRLMTYGGLEVSAATSVTLIWGGRTGTLKHTCCRSALVYLTLFFHSAGATTTDINKHFVFSESLMERSSFVCTVVSTRKPSKLCSRRHLLLWLCLKTQMEPLSAWTSSNTAAGTATSTQTTNNGDIEEASSHVSSSSVAASLPPIRSRSLFTDTEAQTGSWGWKMMDSLCPSWNRQWTQAVKWLINNTYGIYQTIAVKRRKRRSDVASSVPSCRLYLCMFSESVQIQTDRAEPPVVV